MKTRKRSDKKSVRKRMLASKRRWQKLHPKNALAASRKWVKNNPEKVLEMARLWAGKNRNKTRAWSRRWSKNNPEKVAEISRRWRKNNPERKRALEQRRRANKARAAGRHTNADIRKIFFKQRGRCPSCGKSIVKGYHIDHKTPLSRGGSNYPKNIQLLCVSCNCSKRNKTMNEWNAYKKKLSKIQPKRKNQWL